MGALTLNKKALFLDDELNVLRALARVAGRFGIDATIAETPERAFEQLKTTTFALIVSDYRMPTMVGTEFLAKTKQLQPNALRILLTGYADIGAAIQSINEANVYRYLTKPWNDEKIKDTFQEALRNYNLAEENKFLQNEIGKAAARLREINKNLESVVQKRTSEIQTLSQKLKEGFLGSIKLMGTIAHRGDVRSAEHARRVALLSVEVARQLGWKDRDLLEIQVAGYLHDIATSVNDENPKHAQEGFELMQMIPNLGKAYRYVRHHHELMNGSGGPDRLSGDEIPQGARILAVVDAYDEALHLAQDSASATPIKALYKLKQRCPAELDEIVVASLHDALKRLGQLTDANYEATVSIFSLVPGMILARDLVTRSGRLILSKDSELTDDYMSRILKRHAEEPMMEEIYVYRNSITNTKKGVPYGAQSPHRR